MPPLQTVILHHVLPHDSHYDWLLQCPAHAPLPDQRLWTARVALPPGQWPASERVVITPIAPHRAHYLTYEGPVSGNRGHVSRVAQGRFIVKRWTPGHKVIRIRWETPELEQHIEIQENASGQAWLTVHPID